MQLLRNTILPKVPSSLDKDQVLRWMKDVIKTFQALRENTYDDLAATSTSTYTHPNHSGDVTSVGDGAQTIANKAAVTFSNPIYSSQAQTVLAAAAPTVNLKNDAGNVITGIETTWTDSNLKLITSAAMEDKVAAMIAAIPPAAAGWTLNVPIANQEIPADSSGFIAKYYTLTGDISLTLTDNGFMQIHG